MNNNPSPTVGNVSAHTAVGASVMMVLPVSGANATLRIISQPAHGAVGLSGTAATYYPEPGFAGTDTFTFAAYDGAKNSLFAAGTINVGGAVDTGVPTVGITSPTTATTYSASAASLTIGGTATDNVAVVAVTWSNDRGGSGVASGTTNWTASAIPLQTGVNVITVTARDAASNLGTDTLTVSWIKPHVFLAKYYAAGFQVTSEVAGSHYDRPSGGVRVLNFSDGQIAFTGGDLAHTFTNTVIFDSKNHVTTTSGNRLPLTINLATGSFKGKVTIPGSSKSVSYDGVMLQKRHAGYGNSLGTKHSGPVVLGPRS
jgi:hypothetical protein